MPVVSVLDVAKYILSKQADSMTTMKLQKLCYYSQAWHLAWNGTPLFHDPIEAWAKGPVVKTLYDAHRGRYAMRADEFLAGNPTKIDPWQRAAIDNVLSSYGPLSATQLSMLTHAEAPWADARRTLPDGARGNAPITAEAMKDFYSKLQTTVGAMAPTEQHFPAWSGTSWPAPF